MTNPPNGWYPDPYPDGGGLVRWWDGAGWTSFTAPQPDPRQPLDRTMDRLAEQDDRAWGWGPALYPCLALAGSAVLGSVVLHVARPHSSLGRLLVSVGVNAGLYALLAVVVWWSARDVVQRYGYDWSVFGLHRPVRGDIGPAAAGFGIALAARIIVSVVAVVLTHGRAVAESQNIQIRSASIALDALLVLIAVVLAPVLEEIIFRGLLLRTFMRRVGFVPAALASTAIFAGFHTYEVDTLEGALTLAAVVATLGMTNCVLVRVTDRLTPGMVVHATFNAIASAVVIYRASR